MDHINTLIQYLKVLQEGSHVDNTDSIERTKKEIEAFLSIK